MATSTAARTFARAFPRSASTTSSLRLAAPRPSRANAAKKFFQQSSRRHYSSAPEPAKSSSGLVIGAAAAAALLAGGFYFYNTQTGEVHLKAGSGGQSAGVINPTKEDYQKVYDAVAKLLWEKDDYDDGSYGPVLLRLAWHASGTYDAATGTGGSNGATMRFAPEGDHGANAGLKAARDFLEPVKGE
jgi:cytochrome c peroxidase